MRAHVGVRDGYVRHLFRDDSTWCPQLKEEIQPEKVLLRHGRFAILRCLKDEGSSCILKVAISVLDHMSTSRSSYLYTWALCGRRQMGIVLPHEDHDQPDSFLLYDKPQTLPGCSDPSYRPMPDFFEPWAQDYARYESNAGYGQTLEDTALWEPWCWRFVNPGLTSSSTPTQTSVTAEGMSASVDPTVQLQPQDYGTKVSQDSYDAQSGVTAPRDDYDPMTFEPWATGDIFAGHIQELRCYSQVRTSALNHGAYILFLRKIVQISPVPFMSHLHITHRQNKVVRFSTVSLHGLVPFSRLRPHVGKDFLVRNAPTITEALSIVIFSRSRKSPPHPF